MKALMFFFALLISAGALLFLHMKSRGEVIVDASLQPMENVRSIRQSWFNETKDDYVRRLLSSGCCYFSHDSMPVSGQVMYRLRFLDAEMFVLHSYPRAHLREKETWEYYLTRWDGQHIVISSYSGLRENTLDSTTYQAIQSFCKTTTYDTTTKREY